MREKETRILLSYHRYDIEWRDLFENGWKPFQDQGQLDVSYAEIMKPSQIFPHMQTNDPGSKLFDFIILLISKKYLSLNDVIEKEIPEKILPLQERGTRVIPVYIENCSWQSISWLREMKLWPSPQLSFSDMSENEKKKYVPRFIKDELKLGGAEKAKSTYGKGKHGEGQYGGKDSKEEEQQRLEDDARLEQEVVKLEERYKLKFSIETKNIIKVAMQLAVHEAIDTWKLHTREILVAIAYYGQRKERKYNTAQFVLEKLRSKRSDYLEIYFNRIHSVKIIDKNIQGKELIWTGYVADALRAAKRFAIRTTDNNKIHIRHLLAALLFFRAAGRAARGAQILIEKAEIELSMFIREFQQYVKNTFKDDDTEAWQRIFSEKVADEEKSVQIDTLEKIDKKVAEEGAEGEEVEEAVGASIEGSSVPDQPTKIDTLGFEPYTTAIANFLSHENTKPPLTISVEGEWGSGKTSFMMQLGNKLRVKEGLIIEFSPWMHEDQESLWAAFALEFTRQLSESLSWWESIIARVKLLWQRFNWREGWVEVTKAGAVWLVYVLALLGIILIVWGEGLPYIQSVVLKAFLSVAVVAGVIGRALKKLGYCIGSPLKFDLKKYVEMPDYTDRVCFIERFHEDFKKIIDVYAMKKNVYVFIDDLDRCKVPIAAEIMQAINMMISDNPRVTFIMGMDRRKVAASLAVKDKEIIHYLRAELIDKKNEESGSSYWLAGLDYGYSFIEKFIQLPFSIPRPTKSDIDNMIDHIVAKESKEIERKLISIPRSDEDLYGSSDERPSDLKDKREDIDSTPESREEEEVKEEEKRWLELKLADDSEQIRAIVHMIAPFVDYNPRRIKQFINLFRLRAYIAYETQWLILPEETEYSEGLTLEQLGKIVVISFLFTISKFAHSFNGYEHHGSFEKCAAVANTVLEKYNKTGTLDDSLSLDDLRTCLFFEYRRARHIYQGGSIKFISKDGTETHIDLPTRPDEDEETMKYIRALVEAIRAKMD